MSEKIITLNIKTFKVDLDNEHLINLIQEKLKEENIPCTVDITESNYLYDFCADADKMWDMVYLGKDTFLNKYPYITSEEYDSTVRTFRNNRPKVFARIFNKLDEMTAEEEKQDKRLFYKVRAQFLKEDLEIYVDDFFTVREKKKLKKYMATLKNNLEIEKYIC